MLSAQANYHFIALRDDLFAGLHSCGLLPIIHYSFFTIHYLQTEAHLVFLPGEMVLYDAICIGRGQE
jgi:hypothetical protein